MDIWLDTLDLKTIHFAGELGVLCGVTTNPSLLASGNLSVKETLQAILNEQEGQVAVQVTAETAEEMHHQAHQLIEISSRFVIKIPVTSQGYLAIRKLTKDGIPIMATAIFEPHQAYAALKLGVKYAAIYLGRVQDSGKDLKEVLTTIQAIKRLNQFEGNILAAGIRSLDHFTLAASLGIEAATLPKMVFDSLYNTHFLTESSVVSFMDDWKTAQASFF